LVKLRPLFSIENNGGGKIVKIVYKVWLDQNGKAFGDGPFELLKRIERTDSLHEAASQMGMSYSKAWRLIRTMEQRLGFHLIERRVGGPSGGGSWITSEGKDLMDRYERFRKDVEGSLDRLYDKHFTLKIISSKPRRRRTNDDFPLEGTTA
jgi:molybdate transport system regulatory protein